jgi:hypothetical protein
VPSVWLLACDVHLYTCRRQQVSSRIKYGLFVFDVVPDDGSHDKPTRSDAYINQRQPSKRSVLNIPCVSHAFLSSVHTYSHSGAEQLPLNDRPN